MTRPTIQWAVSSLSIPHSKPKRLGHQQGPRFSRLNFLKYISWFKCLEGSDRTWLNGSGASRWIGVWTGSDRTRMRLLFEAENATSDAVESRVGASGDWKTMLFLPSIVLVREGGFSSLEETLEGGVYAPDSAFLRIAVSTFPPVFLLNLFHQQPMVVAAFIPFVASLPEGEASSLEGDVYAPDSASLNFSLSISFLFLMLDLSFSSESVSVNDVVIDSVLHRRARRRHIPIQQAHMATIKVDNAAADM